MSKTRALAAPKIFDGDNWHDDAALVIEDGQISGIVPAAQISRLAEVEHLKSGFLAPGFVDVQVNGGGGVLFNNAPTLKGLAAICAAHTCLGTTALLPTLITDTPQTRDRAIAAGIEAWDKKIPGFAGLHLEGPHLSIAKKGAHDPALIRKMNGDDVEALADAREKLPIVLTTLAPENVTPVQVRALVDAGVRVSIGHSDAGAEAANALLDAGASLVTHLFNAMSQLGGRQPGLVGAALNCGKAHVGLIADSHHVHPASMELALRAKRGPGRIFLISDAMSFAGTDDTELVLNGRKILRAGGRLTLEDGTFAGADLDMATAVHVMHKKVGVELGEALRMASLYPAEAVGLPGAGTLGAGRHANMVWLSDDMEINATWIKGAKTV